MLIEAFLAYLQKEKRYSHHTIKAYRTDLLQFRQYLEDHYPQENFLTIKSFVLRSWLAELAFQNISPTTLRRKKTAITTFYSFLRKNNYITKTPVMDVSLPKKSKKLPSYIDKKQIRDIIIWSLEETTPYETARDLMVFKTLYATGMRVSELIHLYIEDIDFSKKEIKVTGKRNKQRIIPVDDSFLDEIKLFISIRNKTFPSISTPNLFLTNHGKPLYQRLIYRIVSDFITTYTHSSKKNPHLLRHTFATHLLEEGADINAIKELLGHASLNATQIYTHANLAHLKSMYEKFHPKS
jgi:integrase/recombinase XerC